MFPLKQLVVFVELISPGESVVVATLVVVVVGFAFRKPITASTTISEPKNAFLFEIMLNFFLFLKKKFSF
mgnify:CR=1 FL=1